MKNIQNRMTILVVGEAYSILKDDAVVRFSFWLVLDSNSIFLTYLLIWASAMTFFGFLFIYTLIVFRLSFGIGANYYLELFTRYVARLPTRFPKAMRKKSANS
jgi:hypothetical protein